MPSEWEPFSTLFSEPQKNGLTRSKALRGAGMPMVNMGELFAFPRILPMQMDRVPVGDKERSYILKYSDLLFARQSLVFEGAGKCSIFLSDHEPTVFESHIIRCRLDRQKADPLFYFYFFQSPLGRDAISSIVEQGAGAAGIRASDLAKLLVPVPPLPLQNAASAALNALDVRIENLQQTNDSLEAVAKAIFKSWFVDFDPVRTKADGREPEGMEASVAAYFPDEFQDSELGRIPKGWSVEAVGDMSLRVSMGPFGSNIKTDNFVEEGVPVIRGKNLKSGFVDDDFAYVSDSKADELRHSNAFAGDVVITHRGTLGQVGIIPTSSRFKRYVVSQSQMVITVDPKRASPLFLYYYLISDAGQHQLLANTSQTGVPAIARPTVSVKGIKIPLSDRIEIQQAFESSVGMLTSRININAAMVRTLSGIRDTLLPRLISGKLRVSEVENLVEAVL